MYVFVRILRPFGAIGVRGHVAPSIVLIPSDHVTGCIRQLDDVVVTVVQRVVGHAVAGAFVEEVGRLIIDRLLNASEGKGGKEYEKTSPVVGEVF